MIGSRVVALAVLILILAGCTKIGEPTGEKGEKSPPDQELHGSTIRFYQNEILSAVLQSGRLRKFERQATVFLDSGVVIDFFNQTGEHTTNLVCDSARVDEQKRDMLAMGHVVAKSDSGQTLESQFLRWENKTRRIISDAPVKLSTPTDTIFGTGFVSDEHLRNWQVERPTGRTFRDLEQHVGRDSGAVIQDSSGR